jgi:hypothetical protein
VIVYGMEIIIIVMKKVVPIIIILQLVQVMQIMYQRVVSGKLKVSVLVQVAQI